MRSEIENHAITDRHARAAVVQTHPDCLWRDEAARTHDQLGAACLVSVEVQGDQAIDHVTLARQYPLHVDGDGTRHHSEPICVVNQVGDLCAPNLVLAGRQLVFGQEPPINLRSTTAVRRPDLAMCQASNLPPAPLPRTSISKRSGWDIFNF